MSDKEKKYHSLLKQIESLIGDERDEIAVLSNVIAALHHEFKFFWTGIYFVKDHELVLGPFQGPVACFRIAKGKGVCGTSWAENKTVIVKNVHDFPGHIACSQLSKSEIVVPIRKEKKVYAVLDIDSDEFATFDDIDQKFLDRLSEWLGSIL